MTTYSSFSNTSNATTFAALTAPTLLTAVVLSPTSVRIGWSDTNLNLTGFSVERSQDGGSYSVIGSPTSPPYLDTAAVPASTMTYRVRAYRTGSTEFGSYSGTISVVMPIAPEANQPSYLFLLNPVTVFSGQIDMITVAYPLDTISYDNTTGDIADVREGMTITFGSAPGLRDLGRQRVRSLPGAGSIGIGRSSKGTHRGELAIGNNDYFYVSDSYEVWSKLPYIAPNGQIFKDSSVAISDNTLHTPPVANCGPAFADSVNDITGLIVVQFTSTSYTTAPGATITDYLWDVGDGSVTAGSLTGSTVTCSFVAGFRWIHLTVTDSNDKSHTSHAPVYAREEDDETVRNFVITEHSIKQSGQTLSFNIRQEITEYPDGMLVMLWEGEASDPADRSQMAFIGYHLTDPATIAAQRTGLLRDVTLNCVDVAGMLEHLAGYSQILEHDTTPAKWSEYAYLNIDRFIHYLLHWNSTALDLADFQWSGTGDTYKAQQLAVSAADMLSQVSDLCQMFVPDYVFTCNRRGQLSMRADPMVQEIADRTATNQVTLYAFDYTSLAYTHQYFPTISRLNGGAIVAAYGDPTSVFCWSPGETMGQGVESSTREHGLTPSQVVLNQATGHRYARLNNSLDKLRITLAYGDDRGIEPADLTWVTLDLPNTVAAQRGFAFLLRRGLIHEMNIRYDYQRTGTVKTIDLTWEAETVGYIGQTYVPPTTAPITDGGWTPPPAVDPAEPPVGIPSGVQNVAMLDAHCGIITTADFQSTPPTWAVFADLFTDATYDNFSTHPMHSMVVDPFSPLYRSTGTTVRVFAVNKIGIWRIDDIFGADGDPTITPIFTFPSAGNPYVRNRTIMASFGRYFETETDNPWLMVSSHYQNPFSALSYNYTGVVYSKDAGATWSDEKTISPFSNGNDFDMPIYNGLYLSPRTPGLAYAVAWDNTDVVPPGAIPRSYYSTDWGETWAKLTDPEFYTSGMIHVPWFDNADEKIVYYGATIGGDPDPVDFTTIRYDGGGDTITPPILSGKYYGPWRYPFGIRAYDGDRQYMAMAGRGNSVDDNWEWTSTHNKAAVFVSTDGGDNWTNIIAPMDSNVNDTFPDGVAFSGDDPLVIYIWGNQYYVAQSVDGGATVEDKYGNIGGLAYAGYEEVLLFAGGDAP